MMSIARETVFQRTSNGEGFSIVADLAADSESSKAAKRRSVCEIDELTYDRNH